VKLNERQLEIVRLIQRLKHVDVKDLGGRFKTSAVTIRKDLDLLQEKGILLRTHGGALLAENVEKTIPMDTKLGQMLESKQAIARSALDLVFDCQTVALDAGSTTLALARLLKNSNIRIVTNSLLIAEELSDRESGSMVLLGGIWRRESSCFFGPATLKALDEVNIDIAFVGVSGFSAEIGFTCQNSMEAQVKQKLLSRAERRFVLGDSSKYGVRAFSTFARPQDVTGLVVDDQLSPEAREELSALELHIITAQKKVAIQG
jgi:DeoR/GlpR family transcriptional regulator of sugar metabolism